MFHCVSGAGDFYNLGTKDLKKKIIFKPEEAKSKDEGGDGKLA